MFIFAKLNLFMMLSHTTWHAFLIFTPFCFLCLHCIIILTFSSETIIHCAKTYTKVATIYVSYAFCLESYAVFDCLFFFSLSIYGVRTQMRETGSSCHRHVSVNSSLHRPVNRRPITRWRTKKF